MYWLRWHYHVKDIAGAPYKIKKKEKKKRKTKQQNRWQSVVAGRQQLYCAVQSRSPNRCQTTTGKVRSSARNGTSSATVHSWQTTAGCSMHVPKPLRRHGHQVLNVWWTVPPAWLSQQSADDVECRRQMSAGYSLCLLIFTFYCYAYYLIIVSILWITCTIITLHWVLRLLFFFV